MLTISFSLLALIQLFVLIQISRLYHQQPNHYTLILIAVAFGLVYDNGIIPLGRLFGEGALLAALSLPRFIMHALITPLLVIYTFGFARRLGLTWAQSRPAHALACLVATLLVSGNVWQDRAGFNLIPIIDGDLLRYTTAVSHGPPLYTILTIIIMIHFGLVVWRQARWPWLFAGSLFMFITAAVGGRDLLPGNIGEAALMLSLLAGERHLARIGKPL